MLNGDEPAVERAGSAEIGAAQWLSAFAVHILTASGAALGLLALMAAVDRDWPLMFLWLGLALIVDSLDGTAARQQRVAERLPRWSGDTLDLVVDFTTYVLVPAFAIAASGLLPEGAGVPAAVVIVIASALYFADRNMKMADNSFRGFPALWNIAAFYLFIVRPEPWVGVAVIAALVVLTFVPVPFIHPFRVRRLRALSVVLLVLWSVLASAALVRNLEPGPWVVAALCAIALYFFAIGHLRRPDGTRRDW
jgi:phosphatidylcholine synthase